MKEELNAFIKQVPNWDDKKSTELISYFLYFITILKGNEFATPAQIGICFDQLRINRYSNIPAYLSNNSKSKKSKRPLFIKNKNGYQLERLVEADISKSLISSPAKSIATSSLIDLLSQLNDREEKEFLQEAIDCYSIDARRASIVMVWILAIHHLYRYILNHKLNDFNAALSKVTDKRIKINVIMQIDDFSEIPESSFIEIARSSKIISNDVRKILDVKLGIRNSSAHPSSIMISQVKTTDFIIDLVQNVILKYKV